MKLFGCFISFVGYYISKKKVVHFEKHISNRLSLMRIFTSESNKEKQTDKNISSKSRQSVWFANKKLINSML